MLKQMRLFAKASDEKLLLLDIAQKLNTYIENGMKFEDRPEIELQLLMVKWGDENTTYQEIADTSDDISDAMKEMKEMRKIKELLKGN